MSDSFDERDATWTPYASAPPWFVPGFREEIRTLRSVARQRKAPLEARLLGRLKAAIARLMARPAPANLSLRVPPEREAMDARIPASETSDTARLPHDR